MPASEDQFIGVWFLGKILLPCSWLLIQVKKIVKKYFYSSKLFFEWQRLLQGLQFPHKINANYFAEKKLFTKDCCFDNIPK